MNAPQERTEPAIAEASAGARHFGRLTVFPAERRLMRAGEVVKIGSRAFDLLLVLLEAGGQLVSKPAIFERVWPSMVVDESNLRVQITALRSALGDDRDLLKTVQGRGYLLVAEPLPDQPKPDRSPPTPTMRAEAGSRRTVTVIDDDAPTRESLEGLLRSAGLEVETFASASDYLNSAAPEQTGCLVLDVWLHGQSGLELQSDLREAGVQTPIIFMSGLADVPLSVRAMKAGAVEFLTKPVRHHELLESVHSALRL